MPESYRAPQTPESYGASPQPPAGREREQWPRRALTIRDAANLCPNLIHCPGNPGGGNYGCLLPVGVKPGTRNFTGDPDRCKALCDGEPCEALLRLRPELAAAARGSNAV